MKFLENEEKLDYYIKKYNIQNFFTKDISEYFKLVYFQRNEYIFKAGEPSSYFYFFVEGKAKIYKTLSNGKAMLLCFYDDFNILGEVELLNSDDFTTNAQAMADVYCIGIPIQIVREHLLNDPLFLRNICQFLADKLNRITINSSINQLYPLESRLASYITSTQQTITLEGHTVIVFNENLSEIAELLGTSYRHLLRTLHSFIENGLLIKKEKGYEVSNEKKIRQLASDLYQ